MVGVAQFRGAIERIAIGGIERRVEIEPDHEIWITDEGLAKGNEIGAGLSKGLVGALPVKAIIGDDDPAEAALDLRIVEGRNWRAAGIALDHMQIAESLA